MLQTFDSNLTQRWARLAYVSALALIVIGLLTLPIDALASRSILRVDLAGELVKPLAVAESLAHGFGVVLVAAAVFLLHEQNRRALLRILICAFGAGLIANLVKSLVGRTRPGYFDLNSSIAQSFEGWFPVLFAEEWSHANQSFPSAHTATVIGLALALSFYYRRGTVLFLAIAVLAATQRFVEGAHYLSDVFIGAAIACVVTGICFDVRLLGGMFQRFEASIVKKREPVAIRQRRAA